MVLECKVAFKVKRPARLALKRLREASSAAIGATGRLMILQPDPSTFDK